MLEIVYHEIDSKKKSRVIFDRNFYNVLEIIMLFFVIFYLLKIAFYRSK